MTRTIAQTPRIDEAVDHDGNQAERPGREPVSRRTFLQRLGLGAATVVVVADGVVAYRAWDQGVLTEGEGSAYDALKNWQDHEGPQAAVAAAVLAASAHNTQPWAFTINGDRIGLHADLDRTTGANDALLREFYVSLGCALENLVLAAEANGYRTDIDTSSATDADDSPIATVTLTAGEARESELYEAIPDRRSNRSDYTDDPVDVATMSALTGLVDDGIELTWLAEPAQKTEFARLLVDATQAHVDDEEQSVASYRWWRNDWDQIRRHKDGLNIEGVGLSPMIRTLGRILPGTSRSAADKAFLERTEKQAGTAAAFGVLTVADPFSVDAQLRGGRILERLHLFAASRDLGFQHMNQITERIDRDRQLGNEPIFEDPLAELVGAGTLAAFRIGSPTVAAMASPRRPLEEVTR